MKELTATASGTAQASIDACYELLLDVGGYPRWYPDGVKQVEVIEHDQDGIATQVDAVLNAVAGPIRKQFEVRLAVEQTRPSRIALARVADDRELGAAETEITVEMGARLDVPMFLPIDPVAREVANGFLQAALAAV
jgi:hypothetical protein